MGFRPSQQDYRSRIVRAVELGKLDLALSDIERIVEKVFCEPLNVCEIFADQFLDDMCQRIGRYSMEKVQMDFLALSRPQKILEKASGLIFIASRLQASGGHTAVLADIARIGGVPATVLLTGVSGRTNRRAISHRFSDIPNLTFEYAPRASRLARLAWLQRRLLEVNPATVWLFNHHQDSVAVAAVQPDQGYSLKYLHHGDHHLCLGVLLGYGEHYDPHPMGYNNCRDVLSISDNKYLPMVARDLGCISKIEMKSSDLPFVSCTAAGRNKIEAPYWLSYADAIPVMLKQTGGVHIHIGHLSANFRFRIWLNLRVAKVSTASFVYIAHVDSVWQALKDYGVDIYISSFPYAGARTLIEVMGAGVPVAMHNHVSSRFLSILDMAPEGAFVWRDVPQLCAFLAHQSRNTLASFGVKARLHYEIFHAEPLLFKSLRDPSFIAPVPCTAVAHYIDPLRRALAVANQGSFTNVLQNYALKLARLVKSAFF
ncbi:MAG: hypothetical protein H7240_03470 [Glaciimonas sp.]|nr:hypothetical protein [Glaciimonas sp.]